MLLLPMALLLFNAWVANAHYVRGSLHNFSKSQFLSSLETVPSGFREEATALPAVATTALPAVTTTASAAASASVNGTITVTGVEFRSETKALGTVLALFCAALTTLTYATLIGPGTRLLSTSKLPVSALEEDLSNLLSRAWPDTSATTEVRASVGPNPASDAIRLLYVGEMVGDQQCAARGVEDCVAVADRRTDTPDAWLTTGSSLTKSMVQLAVWEWTCLWMTLAMLVSTLSFNGFLTNEKGPDSWPRLVVVLMYIGAYAVHVWYVAMKFQSFLTQAVAGATWSLLNKASFASTDLGQVTARLAGGPAGPVFKQVGKPATSTTFPIRPASLLQDVGKLLAVDDEVVPDVVKSEAATVGDWQKRDVTGTVEAAKTALQGVVANVMTMVGITITTGFSVWTTRSTAVIAETTQLGSLALLASLTLGSAAMFASAVDLSVMDASFRNVLFLKEIMISGQASAHVQKRSSNRNVIGFMHKTVKVKAVGMRDLIKISKLWPLILFGPAFTLLPSIADHERQSAGGQFELHVKVRGKPVLFTTETTSRHCRKDDGSNSAAINVCFEPGYTPSTPTASQGTVMSLLGIWRTAIRQSSSESNKEKSSKWKPQIKMTRSRPRES